jgi:hypothetical protein
MTTEPPADLQAWMDIEQIKQLKARYFRFIDGHNWTELRGLFTDDFHMYRGWSAEPARTTADAFVAGVSKNLGNVRSVHHGHMPEIELTGPNTARGVWAMFDWLDYQDESQQMRQGFGHYHDEYEKGTDGKWRIKSFRLVRIRVDNLPRSNFSPAPDFPPLPSDGA